MRTKSDSTSSSSSKDDGAEDVTDEPSLPVEEERHTGDVAVVFSAPRVVTLQPLAPPESVALAPGELLVKTDISAVSAGTEMLVYRGRMPADVPTDATLAGASGEQAAKPFGYPARYGYASVGTVLAVGGDGEAVASAHKRRRAEVRKGTRVFVFREHASWVVVQLDDVMPIPDGVSERDASFLPNLETALSLAMDAVPLPGENVAVVGQGIVGLLLVAVLKLCYGQTRVIAIDTLADRLRVSSDCANADVTVQVQVESLDVAGQAERDVKRALPAEDSGGVDVAVDVSGTGEGLDAAIRVTRDGGRVVLGSWFGSREVALTCLGGRFHRSHITMVASQVSTIPASLTARWDKSRRFRLAWKLLPLISPSTRFPTHLVPIWNAPSVYNEIDAGKYLQVLFTYDRAGER